MSIHLSELIVVLIVALIVIKPEHLPELAFKMGRCVAWVRQFILKIKHEIGMHE